MKKVIIFISCLWVATSTMANNAVISNISLVGGPGNYRVQFDLSWDNGWRVSSGQNNYDGVWVFFKFKTQGGAWQHLAMNGIGNSIPANYSAFQNTGVTKTGAVIHRANDFSGTSTLVDVELGVPDVPFSIDISGYAIEMVYIPQCTNCIIGDGNGVEESTYALHVADNTSGSFGSTFRVDANGDDDATLEAGIVINADGIGGNPDFTTGQAFWSMKYELSQAAYRDFLNSLTLAQQTTRTQNAPTSAIGTPALGSGNFYERNFIEIATPSSGGAPAVYGCDANLNNVFNEANDGEWIACNYIAWPRVAAYLDWAGLAPMTEIMYERICRGASSFAPNPSVFREYAWGTTTNGAGSVLANPATANEIISNASTTLGNGNLWAAGTFRNGIYATATSNRITSGAAFYGVMEMTGNLFEPCISIGNVAGRGFTSLNGDGVLSTNGNANVPTWPCGFDPNQIPSCSEVTSFFGTTLRGGSHGPGGNMYVSQRGYVYMTSTGTDQQGGRGVLYIK